LTPFRVTNDVTPARPLFAVGSVGASSPWFSEDGEVLDGLLGGVDQPWCRGSPRARRRRRSSCRG
jgi:hypothetical protein